MESKDHLHLQVTQTILTKVRMRLNIPTKSMKERINNDFDEIYQYAEKKRSKREISLIESNHHDNYNCSKCDAKSDQIVTKISGTRIVTTGLWTSFNESIHIQHCNNCGNEWEKKGYSMRDYMVPFTHHDFICMWVEDINYYAKNGKELREIKQLKNYSAEGMMKAFNKAKNKAVWRDSVKTDLDKLRSYLPSVYDKQIAVSL